MNKVYINSVDVIERAKAGDISAMNDIVTSNMGLVKSIAVRFLDRGCEYDDLIQIGSIGIIKAVRGFNPEFGTAFSTYAVPMIAGEIKRFLRDDGMIKISREVKANAQNIFRFKEKFESCHMREPTLNEISSELGIEREDIIFALEAIQPTLSIYADENDDTMSPEKFIGTDTVEEAFDSIVMRDAISKLEEGERKLIELRYYKGLTQQQTAKLLGITQVKVSRDEKKICEKLRKYLS